MHLMKGESVSGDSNPLSRKDYCRKSDDGAISANRRPEIVGSRFMVSLQVSQPYSNATLLHNSESMTRHLSSYPNTLVMNDSLFRFLRKTKFIPHQAHWFHPMKRLSLPVLLRLTLVGFDNLIEGSRS